MTLNTIALVVLYVVLIISLIMVILNFHNLNTGNQTGDFNNIKITSIITTVLSFLVLFGNIIIAYSRERENKKQKQQQSPTYQNFDNNITYNGEPPSLHHYGSSSNGKPGAINGNSSSQIY